MPLEFVGCVGGCDETLREILDLRFSRGPPRASQPASQPSNYLQASQSLNRMDSATRMLPLPAVMGGSNSVTCNCGQEALLLTVRKEGPNQGRQFYKCGGGGCSFFLWADSSLPEAAGPPCSASRPAGSSLGRPPAMGDRWGGSSRPGEDGGGGGGMSCLCSQPAVTRTVQKDGPNKGRQFHTCAKPREQQCGFFQWVDENVAPGEAGCAAGGQSWAGRGAGGGRCSPGSGAWCSLPRRPEATEEGSGGAGGSKGKASAVHGAARCVPGAVPSSPSVCLHLRQLSTVRPRRPR